LYPLIFITYGYTTYRIIKKKKDKKIIIFLAINLILNFAFTPVFSGLMEFGWGALIAALLLISTIYNTYLLNKINKKLALAQVPYIIWLCYALYLSVGVAILN
jgi:tryptophan-rich sensory protein